MSKRNVLVLEVGSSVMKVLTDEGDFLRLPVPADRPRKGQRLVLEEPEKRPALARIGIAVAAAAVIILTAWIGLSQGVPAPPVVALTVALDLNPSLLLGVGADGQVLQVTPANEDGERLSYPTLPAPLPATLTMLLSSASEQGYLRSEPEDVLVFSAWHSPGESPQIDVEGALRQALSDLRLQARLIPLEPGTRDVEEAARLGIPVNRLLIAHRAQAMGLTLSSADLEGAGLVRGLEIIGVLPVPTNPKPATPTPELPDRLPPAPAPAVPAQPAPIKEAPQRPTPVQPPPAGDHSEQPKGAPTQPKSAPTQPESAPTQPESAPTQPESAPKQPESAPKQPESASTQPESAPTQPESAPTQPESAPTQPESAPTQPESAPTQPESAPTQPESAPTQPESAPTQPESTPTQPESAPTQPESTPTEPEPAPTEPAPPPPPPANHGRP